MNILFLVKGLTKNICDIMFNLAKKGCHERNSTHLWWAMFCYKRKWLHWCLSDVKGGFYDFLEWQDRHHRTLEGGGFNKNHVLLFWSERNGSATTMLCNKDHDEAPVRSGRSFTTRRNRKAPCLPHEERNVRVVIMLNELKKIGDFSLKACEASGIEF